MQRESFQWRGSRRDGRSGVSRFRGIYWRPHALSIDVRLCPDAGSNSACVGGVQGCRENTTGPYCTQCLEELLDTHHYNADTSSCEACEGKTGPAVGLLAGLGAARALLDQVQPKESFEALERCVQTLEGVALAAFYIEGESVGRSVGCCVGFGVGLGVGWCVGLPGSVVGRGVGCMASTHDMKPPVHKLTSESRA